jgi:hypothetical protein
MGKIIPFNRFGGEADNSGEMNMSEDAKAIVNFLGCEYEHFKNTMGRVVFERCDVLAAQGAEEGFTPLIIFPTDTLAEILDFDFMSAVNQVQTPEELAAWREQSLAETAKTDAETFLREEQARLEEEYGEDSMPELGSFRPTRPDHEETLHDWAQPMEEALIVKFPTRNPWELAIWAPMGGFNECPIPTDMAAVFRHWNERYGAVPAVLQGHDTWWLRVERPPQSDGTCEALAREHFAFCFDLEAGSIRDYASELRGSTAWQFWWD